MLPSAAIKVLARDHGSEYSHSIMRGFLKSITLFPPGSFIELEQGEIACVVETNPDFPTRPKLEIRLKSDLTPLEQTLIIDLIKNPLFRIRRPVDPHEPLQETTLGKRWREAPGYIGPTS